MGLSNVTPRAQPRLQPKAIPHLAFVVFQMMFAIITPALISGAVVGRMKFKSYVLFIALWSLVVYAPLAHWVWGDGGWIAELGALDFAGGTVVHISSGVAALVAAMRLGPRLNLTGRRNSEHDDTPHNVPMVLLGTALLWFGWIGFNAGSALAADGIAALAVVTTTLGAAAGMTAWLAADMVRKNHVSAVGAAIGAVVGLVAITPAAGFVSPMSAIVIGGVAALVSRTAIGYFKRSSLDDTLDVFACHGIGGVSGALMTGVFASTAVNPAGADGLLHGNFDLLLAQTLGIGAAAALSFVGTSVILIVLDRLVGLRASREAESVGIDTVEHAEVAYALPIADSGAAQPRIDR